MKKRQRRIALGLAVLMLFTSTFSVSAASGSGAAYSTFAKLLDKGLGIMHDGLFATLGLVKKLNIPSYEKYLSEETPYFYKGTDGTVRGDGWYSGFARESIIPVSWRYNAEGKKDPNGYCFKALRNTGGYQHLLTRLYTDQRLSVMILSNGSDSNQNGVKDILLFFSADGVGITSDTCRKMRASVEEALKPLGITAADILSCNVSATHGHNCLDIQGMNITTLFRNKLNILSKSDRSLHKEMEKCLCEQAAKTAETAYKSMEKGQLYFFQTAAVDGANDKINSGVKTQNYFSCFFFEGEKGTKTILADIGAHPTSSGYESNDNNKKSHMLCADYPYFMAEAMQDAGYNFLFTQGAEAMISSPSTKSTDESKAWAEKQSLSREEWVERYGEKFTADFYADDGAGEPHYMSYAEKGYMLAHFILDTIPSAKVVVPTLNIQNKEVVLGLDYGLMYWGAVTDILGFNAVRYPDSETGYGIMVEIGYLELGSDVSVLTLPGELSPAVAYGSAEDYTGKAKWEGETSWSGKDWEYPTIEKIVRDATGDSGKAVVMMGITNDAIGYILPDTICTEAFLTPVLFYNEENGDDLLNSMMLTISSTSASDLVKAFDVLLNP